MTPTARQGELLDFIRRRIAQTGVAPSYEEMARALGIKSKAGVCKLVQGLKQRGRIRYLPRHARSIGIVDPDDIQDALISALQTAQAAVPANRFPTEAKAIRDALRLAGATL